jgi:Ca2+-binding EF-hand superfamily protein
MDGCNTIIALNYRRMKLLLLVDVMGERLDRGVVTATEKLQKVFEYVDEQLKGVITNQVMHK